MLKVEQTTNEMAARSSMQKKSAPQNSLIQEIISILEVDRLIFKSFNAQIAVQMKQEHKKIADYLQESRKAEQFIQR